MIYLTDDALMVQQGVGFNQLRVVTLIQLGFLLLCYRSYAFNSVAGFHAVLSEMHHEDKCGHVQRQQRLTQSGRWAEGIH